MLTGEEVLKLVEAGFTREEIVEQFMQPEPEPEQPPEQEPEQEQEQQPDTVTRNEFEEIKQAMQDLTKAIQANNILTASKATPDKKLTVDEAADAAIKAFFNA